jgi:hypothetical protein
MRSCSVWPKKPPISRPARRARKPRSEAAAERAYAPADPTTEANTTSLRLVMSATIGSRIPPTSRPRNGKPTMTPCSCRSAPSDALYGTITGEEKYCPSTSMKTVTKHATKARCSSCCCVSAPLEDGVVAGPAASDEDCRVRCRSMCSCEGRGTDGGFGNLDEMIISPERVASTTVDVELLTMAVTRRGCRGGVGGWGASGVPWPVGCLSWRRSRRELAPCRELAPARRADARICGVLWRARTASSRLE